MNQNLEHKDTNVVVHLRSSDTQSVSSAIRCGRTHSRGRPALATTGDDTAACDEIGQYGPTCNQRGNTRGKNYDEPTTTIAVYILLYLMVASPESLCCPDLNFKAINFDRSPPFRALEPPSSSPVGRGE